MRKFLSFFLLMAVALSGAFVCGAQVQGKPIPVDKDVIIGKLDNGLTYYIRHNEKPKGQADFYIAQKVGSVLENDEQRGLAHFLEHMCFNGTVNFPGNKVIDWLETKGVKFGYNLNAYTGIDETVYNISNVPVAESAVVDSCLLILHDWADGLLLDPAEIDKERGVIHQEWRRSMVGQMRILENLLPKIYPGSPYGVRLPIGTMEVVDNFAPQVLRDYYEAWYRPDQQGIVVVGDINPQEIEAKIKEIFSPIKMPENAPERVYYPVADNEGAIVAIGKDPEQPMSIVELMFKIQAFPNEFKSNEAYLATKYIFNIAAQMLSARLAEMSQKPDAPFAQAGADFGNFFVSKTCNALEISGIAKSNDIRPVLDAIYREVLRAQRGGFTASEYERARSEYLSRLEKAYENRESRESESYVKEYVRHFIDNEPIPGIEYEYNLMQKVANALPVEYVNAIFSGLITPNNRVVLGLLPDAPDTYIPTDEEVVALMAAIDGENIGGYTDDVKAEPLIPQLPTPGKVVATTPMEKWGATEYTLSNGVKVVVKHTDFKRNEILFEAVANGGTSQVPESMSADLVVLPFIDAMHGLGEYNANDLQKYLQGKQVGLSLSLSENNRNLSGSSTVKDLPTLMELLYMTFANYQLFADDFESLRNMYKGVLANQESTPDYKFNELIAKNMYNSAAKQAPSVKIIEAASRDNILNIIHSQLANAADFTFYFVGDVDEQTLIPLLEQYVATLPADASKVRNEVAINPDREVKMGSAEVVDTYAMQTPQTYAFIIVDGNIEYTPKNSLLANIAAQILSNRLLKTIREDMGAVYSIGAGGRLSRVSKPNAAIQIPFPMKPELKDEVLAEIKKMVNGMTSDIKDDELNPIKEFMVKNSIENLELNQPWLSGLVGERVNGVDTFNGIADVIKAITVADVQDYMKVLLDQNNYSVIVLDPAK